MAIPSTRRTITFAYNETVPTNGTPMYVLDPGEGGTVASGMTTCTFNQGLLGTTLYLVTSYNGQTYPLGPSEFANPVTQDSYATPAMFGKLEDARTFAASQYSAQTAAPFYPPQWWVISEVQLQTQYTAITGYPSPASTAGTLPNAPIDIVANVTDSTNVTISWTPGSPPSPEYYVVTTWQPADPNNAIGTVTTSIGATTATFDPNMFIGYPAGLFFNVTAINYWGPSSFQPYNVYPSSSTFTTTLSFPG